MSSWPTKIAKTKTKKKLLLFFFNKNKQRKKENKKRSCPYVLFRVFSLVFQHSNDLHFNVAACVLKYSNALFNGT